MLERKQLSTEPEGSVGYAVAKRVFDVFTATLCLILFLPVFIACAIAVRLTSRGPIFHISTRIGSGHRPFKMLKFRTMRVGTPQLATHLMTDPEEFLTPVGGFLRRTSLDELPQLLNVIQGSMSLVGPRPALFNQDDQIELRARSGCHLLTPGITGWAQLNGRDEISVARKVELDTWYLHHRSFALDLKILLQTVWNVIVAKDVHH